MSSNDRREAIVAEVVKRCSKPHNFITAEAYMGIHRQLAGLTWEGRSAKDMIDQMQSASQTAKNQALDCLRSFEPPAWVPDPGDLASGVIAEIKRFRDFKYSYPNKGYSLVIETLLQVVAERPR